MAPTRDVDSAKVDSSSGTSTALALRVPSSPIDLSIHLYERGHQVAYAPTMVARMSARRIDDNPREFLSYVWRYQRTYDAHGIDNPALRAPMVVWSALYPAL